MSENGSSSVLRGIRLILVKVVLFQLIGQWRPLDDATPSFFINSESSVLGLSNDISFLYVPQVVWAVQLIFQFYVIPRSKTFAQDCSSFQIPDSRKCCNMNIYCLFVKKQIIGSILDYFFTF